MEKKEEIIQQLGISKNETKVYLALLELGAASINDVAKKSGVYRTNVYDSLKRLVERGLVHYITKDKKTSYGAADPIVLLNLLKEKETKLLDVLPQLKIIKEMAAQKHTVQIYEGAPALRNILNGFLELGEPRYVYGVPNMAAEILKEYFLEKYHKKRVGKKLTLKLIYNSDAKERIAFLNKKTLTESRYLPPEYDSPVATSICGDEVVLTLYSERPISIKIKSKPIAEAYKRYFNLLWGLAKKS